MRHITSIFLAASLLTTLLLTSCKKDSTDLPINPSYKGDFISGVHATSGVATIDQEETTLTLANFKTDSGPDLNIYLAKSNSSVTSDFIDLGDIKGVNGSYTYDLPGGVDYTQYKYVVVWCVDFDVNFGYALLVKQ